MNEDDNLRFAPKPIDAVCIRPGVGTTIQIAIGTIQRIAAIRAYNSYGTCGDWMEKLSTTYVVAIATRSADTLLMRISKTTLTVAYQFIVSIARRQVLVLIL